MRRKVWFWLLIAVLIVLLLGLLLGGYRKGNKLGAPSFRTGVVLIAPAS